MYYLLILRFLKGIALYLTHLVSLYLSGLLMCESVHMAVYVAVKAEMSESTSVCLHILHFHLCVCV